MRMIKTHLLCTALACMLLLAFSAQSARAEYLYEQNKSKFSEIDKVTSRSFKFLVKFNPKDDLEEAVLKFRDQIVKAAKKQGYEFKEPKKGVSWRYSHKCYYDTPNLDIYKKGYVIRENYSFDKGEKPDPDKFALTVKEMSPGDFERLAKSKLAPAPGVKKGKVKFEENISATSSGQLQSYFESAISADISNEELGRRTLGDYAKFFPALGDLGIPLSTELAPPTIGYSVQFKMGNFKLPSGAKMKLAIEAWSRTEGGAPILVSVDMDIDDDDLGYAGTSAANLKQSEDFYNKVFVQGFKGQMMPNGDAYMGSKVRVLFDQKK